MLSIAVGKAGRKTILLKASLILGMLLVAQAAMAQFAQQGSKLVGTGAVGAHQGSSVATSGDGNTAIVGGSDDNSGAGAAWVYARSGGEWSQQGPKLVGTGAVGAANQGKSVAISADGNTAIIGGDNDNNGAGAAWVYTRSGGVWSQQGPKLVGTGAVGSAKQGSSLAISGDGNTAIVGGRSDNSGAGAAWVYTRSGGGWSQQGAKLVGTSAEGAAGQGSSVAISADGDTAIVGGPNDRPSAYVGAAWVYTRSGGVWSQQGAKLVGTSAARASQGYSVAISADGNTAIVGGPGDNLYAGAMWVYTRSGGLWSQQGNKLVGTGAVRCTYTGCYSGVLQGTSVAISADGDTAIVGGPYDNPITYPNYYITAGAVWVFKRSEGAWSQHGSKLVGTGAVGGAGQGHSVAISADGNTAIVGGPRDNLYAGATWVFDNRCATITEQPQSQIILPGQKATLVVTASGAAPEYQWYQGAAGDTSQPVATNASSFITPALLATTNYWVRVGNVCGHIDSTTAVVTVKAFYSGTPAAQQGSKLVGTGAVGGAEQGYSVAISADGNTAIVGGKADNSSAGAAWVYTRSGGVWSQQGNKLVGTGAAAAAGQGESVAISGDGNTVIVGGPGSGMNPWDPGAGAAWVYTRSGGVWSQQGNKLVGTGAVYEAGQGRSVAISADGNTVIVGGDSDASGAGAAWVFGRSGGVWSQQGSKLVGTGADGRAYQGSSVAISGDGNTAIVGGPHDGFPNGAAWIFRRNGGVWSQLGSKLVGTGATGREATKTSSGRGAAQGSSVAISGDGNTAIVGGPYDGLDGDIGAAWVFRRSGGVWSQQGNKLVGTGATYGGGQSRQGWSVAISADGNIVVLGGPWVGESWVFTRSGGAWSQLGRKLVGTGAVGITTEQGSSVAISADGKTIIVGGPRDNSHAGAAWVFTVPPCESSAVPVANFAYTPASPLAGAAVTFTDQSSNVPTGWLWNFGDGTDSGALPLDASSVMHTYGAAGTYTVAMVAANCKGSNADAGLGGLGIFHKQITVSQPCTEPSITAQPQGQSIPSGQTGTLSVTATGTPPLTYQWYQGASGDTSTPLGANASSFTTPALTATTSYWVRVSNACGHDDSAAATTTVMPCALSCSASVTPSTSAAPVAASFTSGVNAQYCADTPSLAWTFGDGESSAEVNPSHTYQQTGSYPWTLTVTVDDQTCTASGTVEALGPACSGPYSLIIPAAAHSNGVWQTDVDLLNRGAEPASIDIALLKSSQTNLTPQAVNVEVGAGQTLRLPDILGTLLPTSNAALALRFCSGEVFASSRFYNIGTPSTGTFGMAVPAMDVTRAITDTRPGVFHNLTYSPDPKSGYRVNLGFANASPFPVNMIIRLYGDAGELLGTKPFSLRAYTQLQWTKIHQIVGTPPVGHGWASVEATTKGAVVLAYAMLIDNLSQDPLSMLPELLPNGLPAVAGVAGEEATLERSMLAVAPCTGPYSLIIPAAANSNSVWKSDVDLLNLDGSPASVDLALLKTGETNLNPTVASVEVPAGQTLRIADILGSVLPASNAALAFRFCSGQAFASSRFFNIGTAATGTFGMAVPGLPVSAAITPSTLGVFHHMSYSTDPKAGYRVNLGFANASPFPVGVILKLYGDAGELLGTKPFSLRAYTQLQWTKIHQLMGTPAVTHGWATVEVTTPNALVHAYQMLIDNLSNDPAYFAPDVVIKGEQ